MKDNRERFSASVSEAAAQLRNYSKFFDERVNRENFQNRYPHLKVYKPKMVVVIGRRDYRNPIAQQEIMADNPYLILKNYDDLLDHIKNAKKLLENRNNLFR